MTQARWDSLWIADQVATMQSVRPYGLIEQAAIAVKEGKIAWIGELASLQQAPEDLADEVHTFPGRVITPGLIDCHTHLVFAGNRSHEFEARLQGKSYADIAIQGGGIQATVLSTRGASETELLEITQQKAKALIRSGVTTIEIKSGYGLSLEDEFKMLRVIQQLQQTMPITFAPTLLAAHALPLEYKDRADDYIDLICEEMIPAVKDLKLATAVDVFCESIGFTLEQTERVFKAAKLHGLDIKVHSDQLSNLGATKLAGEYGALSADHLEYATEADIISLSEANATAVLLPGAFYYLNETQRPPIALMHKHNVPIAIATDANPGSSPMFSILLAMNMACVMFGLTPEQALTGVTVNAAKALGFSSTKGILDVGMDADFVIWDIEHPAELAYYSGVKPVAAVITQGTTVNLD